MDSIFEGAKFDDRFLTRDGHKAVYGCEESNCHDKHFLLVEGFDDVVVYKPDGTTYLKRLDIVAKCGPEEQDEQWIPRILVKDITTKEDLLAMLKEVPQEDPPVAVKPKRRSFVHLISDKRFMPYVVRRYILLSNPKFCWKKPKFGNRPFHRSDTYIAIPGRRSMITFFQDLHMMCYPYLYWSILFGCLAMFGCAFYVFDDTKNTFAIVPATFLIIIPFFLLFALLYGHIVHELVDLIGAYVTGKSLKR